MTSAAIYTRVSTEEQAEHGISLEVREKRLRALCAAHGWEVTNVYCDAGFSARR